MQFFELFSPDSSCQFLPFLNSQFSLKHPKICATHTRAVEATTRNIKILEEYLWSKLIRTPPQTKRYIPERLDFFLFTFLCSTLNIWLLNLASTWVANRSHPRWKQKVPNSKIAAEWNKKKDRKKENSLHINTLPKQKDRQQEPWISSPELIIHPVFEMRKKIW